jgi:hypothetical protein
MREGVMKYVKFRIVLICLLLTGCAGSASHEILTENKAGDDRLTCDQLDSEVVKAQVVIDGVKQDQKDVSGKDVVDGVLWFPFNLIAKNSNYKNSLEAADKRLAKLAALKREKGCSSTPDSVKQKTDDVLEKIGKLNALYKDGALTKEEYVSSKKKLLDEL